MGKETRLQGRPRCRWKRPSPRRSQGPDFQAAVRPESRSRRGECVSEANRSKPRAFLHHDPTADQPQEWFPPRQNEDLSDHNRAPLKALVTLPDQSPRCAPPHKIKTALPIIAIAAPTARSLVASPSLPARNAPSKPLESGLLGLNQTRAFCPRCRFAQVSASELGPNRVT